MKTKGGNRLMKYRSKMSGKYFAATMSVMLIVSTIVPMASANQGNNGKSKGEVAHSEQRGNNAQGPKRAIDDVEIVDSTSFIIDFDKTYPKGIDINRMIEVEVELMNGTVIVPDLTDYSVSSDDRSLVTVEHKNDDLEGLVGTLKINDFESDFDNDTFDLTIMHTNDTHGRTNMYPQLVTAVDEVREEDPHALLLDAGDVFSGTLYFNEFRGMDAVEFMNLMEYDAFVPGNHEFDLGTAENGHPELARFLSAMEFPTLAANLDFSGDGNFDGMTERGISRNPENGTIYDGIIKEVGGEEVGIFGLDTEDTLTISSPHAVEFSDYIETAENMVAKFEAEGVNKIIALTHLGYESSPDAGNDLLLAEAVDGIDVIVGGHSHDQVMPPRVIETHDEPTIIVQAGEYGNYLGHLQVTFSWDGVVIDHQGDLIDVSEKEENLVAAEMLEPYTEAIEEVRNTPAGFSLEKELSNPRLGDGSEVSVRANETELGNLIADGFLRAGKRANEDTVISFQNGGGIRAPLPAGDVTVGELITVQPFGNRLTLLELTGAEIVEALEHSVKDAPGENGGFLHISGMRFTYDSSQPAGERVVSAEVKQGNEYEALDLNKVYVTSMNNFTANGGDGFDVFGDAYDDGRGTIVGDTDWEILRNHALQLVVEVGEVNPKIEGRILDLNSAASQE